MATIITNHHKRPVLYSWDIPPAVLASDFEWTDESESFFCYKGQFYALSEFVRLSKPGSVNPWSPQIDSELAAWDGLHTDSFFSGILVKNADDGNSVVVGLYLA